MGASAACRVRSSAFHPPLQYVVTARRLHLCEVVDGRITAVTTYCNGGWNAELRARHAAEAPMIRT